MPNLDKELISLLQDYVARRLDPDPAIRAIVVDQIRNRGISDELRDSLLGVLPRAVIDSESLNLARDFYQRHADIGKSITDLNRAILELPLRIQPDNTSESNEQTQAPRQASQTGRPDWRAFWALVLATFGTLLVAGIIVVLFVKIGTEKPTASIQISYDIGGIIQAFLGGGGILIAGLAYAFRSQSRNSPQD